MWTGNSIDKDWTGRENERYEWWTLESLSRNREQWDFEFTSYLKKKNINWIAQMWNK